jgi:hypothetical protein
MNKAREANINIVLRRGIGFGMDGADFQINDNQSSNYFWVFGKINIFNFHDENVMIFY